MKKLIGKWPNGENYSSFRPTSTREIKRLLLMYGISAWPVKWGGYYDLLYPGQRLHPTGLRCVDDATFKGWLEIARENATPKDIFTTEYSQMPGWANYQKIVERQTDPY